MRTRPLLALLCAALALPALPTGAQAFDPADAAAPEVPSLRFTRFRNWQPLDGPRVVLWDGEDRPWLVEVAPPCRGLRTARVLGVTAQDRRVHIGADQLVADGNRCRIQHLSRLDVGMLAANGALPTVERIVVVRPRPLDERRIHRPAMR